MKTQSTKPIVTVIAALTIGASNVGVVKADSSVGVGSLIYDNSAYIYPIHGSPNPAADRKVQDAEIVYVNMAYGPAIYSYSSNVAFQSTDFNVHYIDTAHGPAIYSYPSNNPQPQHRLNLVSNVQSLDNRFVTPVSAMTSPNSISAVESNY